MKPTVKLFSKQVGEIANFLMSFYSANPDINIDENEKSWTISYDNPVEISDIIAVLVDNDDMFNISMWVCLDNNVYIRITQENSDSIIRYLFERYPY